MSEVAYSNAIRDQEIRISETAREQLKGLINSVEEEIAGIRIFVSGGGCGGMTYGMTYAESVNETDKVLEGDGYRIMVDPVALAFLRGCDIDFTESGLNQSFVFNNVFQSVGGSGGCAGCGGGGF